MSKETFYFSHDYNARSDTKIKQLIFKLGMKGYGIYWAIVEDLYSNENKIPLNINVIAYELREDEKMIESLIYDFDLFEIDEDFFWSKSVQKRLDARDQKSKNARDNALKRWGEREDLKKANDHIFYIVRFYDNDENFIKCGITSKSVSKRFSGKTNGYEYELLYQSDNSIDKSIGLENIMEGSYKKYIPNRKFGGYLECFDISEKDNLISRAMQSECNGNAIKESKVKESKVNTILLKKESKEIFKNDVCDNSQLKTPEEEKEKSCAKKERELELNSQLISIYDAFDIWWDLYDKKTDTKKAKDKFFKLNDLDIVLAIEKTPKYILSTPDKKYRKNAVTWLNGQCWNDELELTNQNTQTNGFKTDTPGIKRQYQYDHERAMQALNGTIK